MREQIMADFQEIHARLRQIEKAHNPQGENLHFFPVAQADASLYVDLLQLARKGLAKIRQHRDYFLKHALYDDGMFWYDLFLLISAGGVRVKAGKSRSSITPEVINGLTEVLVEISVYTVLGIGGDIIKRNYEALGNTLWAFYSDDLVTLARLKAREVGVIKFVDEAISGVQKLRNNENKLTEHEGK